MCVCVCVFVCVCVCVEGRGGEGKKGVKNGYRVFFGLSNGVNDCVLY